MCDLLSLPTQQSTIGSQADWFTDGLSISRCWGRFRIGLLSISQNLIVHSSPFPSDRKGLREYPTPISILETESVYDLQTPSHDADSP